MGKRSNFARRDRDSYNTPLGAVLPLLARLDPDVSFVEPCAGAGYLTRWLESAGHTCLGEYDLPTDARTARYDIPPGAAFITNPPFWGRPADLHPLICNLSDQAPAWLLLPADWLHNQSSAPLMPRLRIVISVGRVKWLPGTKHTSLDNVVWALFGAPSDQAVHCVGRPADLPFKPSGYRFVKGRLAA